jgi:pilus assembly protein Flp/PilA
LLSQNEIIARQSAGGTEANLMAKLVLLFLKDDAGTTAIEYALIAAGVAMAIVFAVAALGVRVNTDFTNVSNGFK